jgi:hypothetical protein
MAFSTPPDVVSMKGDAAQVRHVYLSGLAKSYVVWMASIRNAGYYFIKRPAEAIGFSAVPHDDVIIAGPFYPLSFDVYETTANVVLVVFAQADGIWSFEFNFDTDVMVTAPALQFAGEIPSMADEDVDKLLVTYLRDRTMYARKTLAGGENFVVQPSAGDYQELDTHRKGSASYVIRHVALQGSNPEAARPLQAVAQTEAMYDSGLTDGAGALYDLSGNGLHLTLGGGLHYNAGGVQFDGSFDPSIAVLPVGAGNTFEAWITPRFGKHTTHIVNGDMFFGFYYDGRMFFGFDGGGEILYVQTGGQRLRYGQAVHVAASHLFTSKTSTLITINGSQVKR